MNLTRVLRQAWSGVREDWQGTAREARLRWGTILGAGLGVSLIVDAAVVLIGQRLERQGALDWEAGVILGLAERNQLTFFDAMWLDAFGSSAMILPVLAVAGVLLARTGRGFEALQVLGSYVGARALMHFGWALWSRPRPELVHGGVTHPSGTLHAFPSGHLVQLVCIYGFLLYLGLRSSRSLIERVVLWILFAGFVVLTAVARLRLGSHWPTDVVAGALLGAAWLATLILAMRVIERARGDHPRARVPA